MMGVEIANDFTVTEHVQQLAMSSAQTIYAQTMYVFGTQSAHCCYTHIHCNFHSIPPQNESYREGTKVSIIIERKLYLTLAPGNEWSWEQKSQ